MNIFKSGLAACVAIALSGALSAASAATVKFDFDTESSGGWKDSLSYSAGGIDLKVTGTSSNGKAAQVATWKGWGLGVCNNLEQFIKCSSFANQHAIDSFVFLEDIAVLTFSKPVTLTKLVFNNLGNTNTFDLFLDDEDDGWSEVLSGESEFGTYIPSKEYTSLSFGIGAGTTVKKCEITFKKSWCREKTLFSAFKLRSVEVEPYDPPAAVPLPAAGVLLLAGLGGLAALRRRKRV